MIKKPWGKMACKRGSFEKKTGLHQRFCNSAFTRVSDQG